MLRFEGKLTDAVEIYGDYNKARNATLDWLEKRGFKAEKPTLGKLGTSKGKPIGMQSVDGKVVLESNMMVGVVRT